MIVQSFSGVLRAVSRPLTVCALALFPLFALGVQDEMQIYTDELTEAGEFALEFQGSFIPTKRPPLSDERLDSAAHTLRISPDVSYGLTPNLQIGAQIFAVIDGSGHSSADGGRLELTYMGKKADDDGYFWGFLVEAGRLPRVMSTARLNAEIKGIFGYRNEQWLLAVNPIIDKKISGEGVGEPADLGLNLKASYRVAPGLHLGIEHFGDLGAVNNVGHLSSQSQQTFLTTDMKVGKWELNGGVGRGWNDASDKWAFKFVIGIPFDD